MVGVPVAKISLPNHAGNRYSNGGSGAPSSLWPPPSHKRHDDKPLIGFRCAGQ